MIIVTSAIYDCYDRYLKLNQKNKVRLVSFFSLLSLMLSVKIIESVDGKSIRTELSSIELCRLGLPDPRLQFGPWGPPCYKDQVAKIANIVDYICL